MTYRRYLFLLRVRDVIEEYEKHSGENTTIAGTHRVFILPKFHITEGTLRQYLQINFKKEIREYEKEYKNTTDVHAKSNN
jgi:hypothetical protein